MGKVKRQLTKAAAIGVAGGLADVAATSGWMHRSLTHKSAEYHPLVELPARTTIWGTGVMPRMWAAVHRVHHEKADVEGDPHSPVMQGKFGVLKLLWRNPFLYRNKVKELEPRPIAADLEPDKFDKLLFDKTKTGLAASLIGHMLLNKMVGNPKYMGVVSFGIEKAVYVAGGNAVNAMGHAGKHPLKALVTGNVEPHEDGTFGADNPVLGVVTFGEGHQKWHHEHPGDAFFGPLDEYPTWPGRFVRDPVGAATLAASEVGLAVIHSDAPAA